MTRLEKLGEAVKKHEGFFPGSKAYINNNPGNLRFDEYRKSLGADYENLAFAHFPDYETGWKALLMLLEDSIRGKRKGLPYNDQMTLPEFFGVYSFVGWADKSKGIRKENYSYAKAVADDLIIGVNTTMAWFLLNEESEDELGTLREKLEKIKQIVNG